MLFGQFGFLILLSCLNSYLREALPWFRGKFQDFDTLGPWKRLFQRPTIMATLLFISYSRTSELTHLHLRDRLSRSPVENTVSR